MTVTVSPWVVWGVLSLALFGLVFLWQAARDGVRDVWEWARRDRVTPLLEDDRPEGILCAGCAGDSHCDGIEGGCDCTCGWSEGWAEDPLEELPPERSAEALGFLVAATHLHEELARPMGPLEREMWHDVQRERRAPWWEVQQRAAYASMGFEFPSGLMARVREARP